MKKSSAIEQAAIVSGLKSAGQSVKNAAVLADEWARRLSSGEGDCPDTRLSFYLGQKCLYMLRHNLSRIAGKEPTDEARAVLDGLLADIDVVVGKIERLSNDNDPPQRSDKTVVMIFPPVRDALGALKAAISAHCTGKAATEDAINAFDDSVRPIVAEVARLEDALLPKVAPDTQVATKADMAILGGKTDAVIEDVSVIKREVSTLTSMMRRIEKPVLAICKWVVAAIKTRKIAKANAAFSAEMADRYKAIKRLKGTRYLQVKAVIDWTCEHPIVFDEGQKHYGEKYGLSGYTLSHAVRDVFKANEAEWSKLKDGYPDVDNLKVACYAYRGKKDPNGEVLDPFRYQV